MARDVDASNLAPVARERGPYGQLEQADLRRLILKALGELPAALAEAVKMRDLQEYSYQEIADQLGLPEGTVKSRINRGRTELARQIQLLRVEFERPRNPPASWQGDGTGHTAE